MSVLPESWDRLLDRPFAREPCRTVLLRAEAEAAAHTVYPPAEDWFAALRLTPPEAVRAVILGQDPYHEPGQAMGLAFSVRRGVRLPPSLRNMYRELETDLGCRAPESGDLTFWAEQGVLLLNTVLTVEAGRANSHKDLGWQAFTGEVLAALTRLPQPIAFVLWGAPAQRAFAGIRDPGSGNEIEHPSPVPCPLSPVTCHLSPLTCPLSPVTSPVSPANCQLSIVNCQLPPPPRLILKAPHPSPLSAYRGFFGSRPYSKINAFLRENGLPEIVWSEP